MPIDFSSMAFFSPLLLDYFPLAFNFITVDDL